MFNVQDKGLSDIEVSERDKLKRDYLVSYTDTLIARLVVESGDRRKKMFKMRDMFEGVRDPLEYKYLEDNYGIGNPGKLEYTNIIRNRINVLIGLLSTASFDYRLSVMDHESIDFMMQEKAMSIVSSIYQDIMTFAQKAKDTPIKNKDNSPYTSFNTQKAINDAKNKVDKEWRSILVDACNNLIN